MNKTLITELERAREIMGLKTQTPNLLMEQSKFIASMTDDLVKLFSKSTSRKVAAEYAEKMSKLLSKSSRNTTMSLFSKMTNPKNTIRNEAGRIIGLKGSGGGEYSIKQIRAIIRDVSNGKMTKKDLDFLLAQLPRELADGSGFRSSFAKQMKNIMAGIEKEAIEKAEKEAIEKGEKEAIEKSEKEAIEKGEKESIEDGTEVVIKNEVPTEQTLKDLIDLNVKQTGKAWYKDIKLRLRNMVFGKNLDGDVLLLKSNALLKWMDKVGVKNMDDLLTKLKDAKRQALNGVDSSTKRAIEKMKPEELVEQLSVILKENAERIMKGEPIYDLPPGLVDEIQSLLLMSNHRKLYLPGLNTAWVRRRVKDIDAQLSKTGKNALDETTATALRKEKEDLLKSIVGTHIDAVSAKSLGVFQAKVSQTTMGGMGRWMIRDIWNISKTLGFFTLSLIVSSITNAFLNQFGGTKAIAGLTKNFYEKFRGHKWMVHIKGGLTDDNAKKGAKLLKKYVRGWALIRDWAVESNFKDRLEEICGEDDQYKNGPEKIKGTVMGCTQENQLRFWNKTVSEEGDIADWSPWASADDVGAFKLVTGTNDAAIIGFYENYVPTILAASQITYFYEEGQSYKLLDDLDAMSSVLPIIGVIDNWVFKTKGDVMSELNNNKPWILGEGDAGTDFALVLTEITTKWPEFATTRKTDKGETWYSVYKPGAKISPTRLAKITDANNYVAGSFDEDDVYKAPQVFALWLDNLTVEEFNDGFCEGIEGDCRPYVKHQPHQNDRLKGYDTEAIKSEVTTTIQRLIKSFHQADFWNNWWTAEDTKTARGEQVDIDLGLVESTKPKPLMEGLIRILLNDLNK
jgi:hypothetical protein